MNDYRPQHDLSSVNPDLAVDAHSVAGGDGRSSRPRRRGGMDSMVQRRHRRDSIDRSGTRTEVCQLSDSSKLSYDRSVELFTENSKILGKRIQGIT